jgi:transcriptional regulator with XRE-family HTH domain
MLTTDIDKFYADIGKAIKSARLRRELSQDILARHLNLTKTSIINLEKGRHRPSIYQLILIAETLQINYADLIPYEYSLPNKDVPLKTQREILENMDNAVTDQKLINKSSRKVVFDFLTSIKK